MTQEDKDLLLRDLSARLPYGVKVNHKGLIRPLFSVSPTQYYQITLDNAIDGEHNGLELVSLDTDAEDIKLYLRPMSSMTEEELAECRSTCKYRRIGQSVLHCATIETFNWLNAHHFDYRTDDEGKTMIEKGLALEAPKGMYH